MRGRGAGLRVVVFLECVMRFLGVVNEGRRLTFSVALSEFGIETSEIFDWTAAPDFTGAAVADLDYSYSFQPQEASVMVTIFAIR